jgi:glycosyltransferase involved in cell wall biosynthesis
MRSTQGLKSALSWPDAAEPVLGADADAAAVAATSPLPSICFVAPLAWPILAGVAELKIVGGAEVQQSILARALAEAGFRVSMVCNDFGQADGVRVHGVTVYKSHGLDQGIPVVRFLHPRLSTTWAALRRANADIYYTRSSSMLAGVITAFCKRHARKSVYAAASDIDFVPERQPLRFRRDRWMYEYGVRNADAIIVQNAFQQETCFENYGRRATVIPSCYAPPPGAAADENGTVLWTGTVRDYKQPELLIEIARRLPQHRFVMVGGAGGVRPQDIEYFEGVKRDARPLRNVELAGFVPYAGVEAYFNRARVFVNTSRYEGFPNTFLQAWARGVPTVSFVDTGSRHGLDPVYAVVRDVSEATREISRLMLDDDHWRAASARCRAHYWAYHSMGSVTARYSKALTALAGGAR